MKMIYGAVIVAMGISGLHGMDDAAKNSTKQAAAMSFSSKFTAAMSSSTPTLPYASSPSSVVSPRGAVSPRTSSSMISSGTPRSRSISSPRPPSPSSIEGFDHKKYEPAAYRSFSEKKLSSSSLPTIPDKK